VIPDPSTGMSGLGPFDFVLEGGGGLGDVPAEDVATFIHQVVRVVARAAGHAVGRPVKDTGRYEAIVKAASKIRIQSITSSSVHLTMLPSPHEVIQLGDNLGLDAESVSERALAIARDAAHDRAATYPDVANAWVELAERVGVGKRYTRVVVSAARDDRAAVLDVTAIERLRRLADDTLRGMATDMVRGVLYAANFETLTAKLRNQVGDVVDVDFDIDHAPEIKEALRNPTTISGSATYDRRTNRIATVRLEAIAQPVQLLADDFWTDPAIEGLLAGKAVGPLSDPTKMRLAGLNDDEWESFFEALVVES
jgi:hypothetical protein